MCVEGATVLEPAYMEMSLGEVDHIPAQGDELGGAQAVPVGDEDHGAVAVSVAAKPLATGLAQALDLFTGQELARAYRCVGEPGGRSVPFRMVGAPLRVAVFPLRFIGLE